MLELPRTKQAAHVLIMHCNTDFMLKFTRYVIGIKQCNWLVKITTELLRQVTRFPPSAPFPLMSCVLFFPPTFQLTLILRNLPSVAPLKQQWSCAFSATGEKQTRLVR